MLISLLPAVLGYYLFYCCVIRKNSVFFPVIFISFTVSVIYLFGIMEIIDFGVYLVAGFGCFLLIPALFVIIRQITQTEKAERRTYVKKFLAGLFLNNMTVFMILCCVWVYFLMKGSAPSHCDDFTHWYRICKIMDADRTLPSSPDLRFQYYPPGTALWIYFLTRFIPFSVPNCFRTQSLLNASCIAALMSVIPQDASKKAKAAGFICVCIAGTVLCAMDVTAYSLLVDGTLGLVPAAAVTMILMEQNSDRIQYILLLFVACFIAIIKNSGLLFVLFIAIAWAVFNKEKLCYKSGNSADRQRAGHWLADRRSLLEAAFLIAVPIGFYQLYQNRAARIFGNKGYGKHQVSLSRYLRVFHTHEAGQNLDIIRNYLCQVFLVQKSCSQIRMLWIVIFAAAGLFLLRAYFRRSRTAERYLIVYTAVCGVVYMAGLLLTYLFSMSKYEATGSKLVCLFRYSGTCTIFISALVFLYFGSCAYQAGVRARRLAVFGLTCGTLLLGTALFDTGYIWGFDHFAAEEKYTTKVWELFKEYVPENREYSPYKYVIVWNPDDFENDLTNIKIHYATMAYMRADHVEKTNLNRFKSDRLSEKDKESLREADYLILLGDFHDQYEKITEYIPVQELSPGLNQMHGSVPK